ncbi:LysR family transcriptional regulator [Maridesulfovibrio sp.]|uniref:LysR family transcriptional regulator n=1 Tax=Maridesulfovibrio sp. TaxID=2795000 RepID=UPI0029CA3C98|nr:LysR family transcriptional regulator [Maridesulfovibrio sp.]
MEIRHLLSFKEIVEQGSFMKAAQLLNYAQSSITSHVRVIEDFYGQPVFDRLGKRVVLNSFGERLYHRVLPLLAGYDDLCGLKNEVGEPAGQLRIGAPESTMLYRLSPVLQKYKSLYPKVELIMHNSTCPDMRGLLRDGSLDMAVLLDRMVDEDELTCKPLFDEPMCVVLPREYPADELIYSPSHAVLYTEAGCSYRQIFQQLLADKDIKADNIIETASVEVIKQYLLCNIGVSFLPGIVVRKELSNGRLKAIPWKSLNPILIQIVHHKDKWISPAMKEFMRLLEEAALGWSSAVSG